MPLSRPRTVAILTVLLVLMGGALLTSTFWTERLFPTDSTPTQTAENSVPLDSQRQPDAQEGTTTEDEPFAAQGVADSPSNLIISNSIVTTTRVSNAATDELANDSSHGPSISADGRFVTFTSKANNLVADDDNGYDDVFLFDRSTGETHPLSKNQADDLGNSWSRGATISADGRRVAFYSWAGNLVSDDTNAVQDVFLADRQSGLMQRVSVSSNDDQANDRSGDNDPATRPALSADGAVVAFHSRASNLVAQDTNQVEDVFVHDTASGDTQRVSLASDGSEGNGAARNPSLSGEGRFVVFESEATNLSALSSADGTTQIFIHDQENGQTELISKAPDGGVGNGASSRPAISRDGQAVVFQSAADNLTPDDTNRALDIFVYDRLSDSTSLVSVASAGVQGNRDSTHPAISADGRHVAFLSEASNLVNGDTNEAADIFVHDRQSLHTERSSLAVVAPQKGLQADGPSLGPPALSSDARVVAFAATSPDLTARGAAESSDVFVHERRDSPVYPLAGRVIDWSNQPLADVVVAAGPHRARTDDAGRYVLPHLTGGTYTLDVSRPGYLFAPERRTVSVPYSVESQDFVAFVDQTAALQFLDLPVDYDNSQATFVAALRDTESGGWIDAWFDHAYPDYGEDRQMLLWDGRLRSSQPYNAELGCYERRCYDGHDGVDFPYRDPDPATGSFEPLSIRPAATGIVIHSHVGCVAGDRGCNGGYGNEVVVNHGNGFLTRYAHLGAVAPTLRNASNVYVSRGDSLGTMGSTGNSQGAHLHFSVHQDNGNTRWDGAEVDVPLDPFGWTQDAPDPWVIDKGGAASRWLWRHNPTTESFFLGSRGAILRDPSTHIVVTIPPGAFQGQLRLELSPGTPPASPQNGWHSLGRSFSLQVLEWIDGGEQQAALLASPTSGGLPSALGFSIDYAGVDARHFDLDSLTLHWWDPPAEEWRPTPTINDAGVRLAQSASNLLGDYDLQAQFLCPEDRAEPNDSYHAATPIEVGAAPVTALFDIEDDEDWFRLEVETGNVNRIVTENLGTGVQSALAIYDVDGLSRLAATRGSVNGAELSWQAPADGTYFLQVTPVADSAIGCEARYSIGVE